MEHTEKTHALAVAARIIRRKWRRPARAVGFGLLTATSVTLLVGFQPFKVRRAEPQQIQGHQVVSGAVESLLVKNVGTPVGGMVEAMSIRPGQKVKRGDLLFQVDTAAYEQQLGSAREARDSAVAAYRQGRKERDAELAGMRKQIAVLEKEIAQERRVTPSDTETPQVVAGEAVAVAYAEDGTVIQTVAVEPAANRLADLEESLRLAREQYGQKAHDWDASLYETWLSYSELRREVSRLEGVIAGARRRSPMDGVVTAVYATKGSFVEPYRPVVRVDDPKGYRVVALVDEKLREGLKPGTELDVQRANAPMEGRVEKIVKGWDEELFKHWIWVKPVQPAALKPGEPVQVTVPTPEMVALGGS